MTETGAGILLGVLVALAGVLGLALRRPGRRPVEPSRPLQDAHEARHEASVRRVERADQDAAGELDRVASLDPSERARRAAERMRDL